MIGHVTTHNYYAHLDNLNREIAILRFEDPDDDRPQDQRNAQKASLEVALADHKARYGQHIRKEIAAAERGLETLNEAERKKLSVIQRCKDKVALHNAAPGNLHN